MRSEIYWVWIEINNFNIENNWLKLRSDITTFKDKVFKLLLNSKQKIKDDEHEWGYKVFLIKEFLDWEWNRKFKILKVLKD